MPWWGWLIGSSVAAFCVTAFAISRTVTAALVRYGKQDAQHHAELLRGWSSADRSDPATRSGTVDHPSA